MCIGDWRLGRLITYSAKQWTVSEPATMILPPNKQRVGLYISSSTILTATQGYSITFGGFGTIAVNGLSDNKFFSLQEHGGMVQQQVLITALSLLFGGIFGELTMPEDYLYAGLEEFRRQHGMR